MPAGPDTGTVRSTAELLYDYGDYRSPQTSDRQLQRDLVVSFDVVRNMIINVKDWPGLKAKGDCKKVSDGVMAAASANLNSLTALFTAADVGKRVSVSGAGALVVQGGTVSAVAGAATFSASQAGVLANGLVLWIAGAPYVVSGFNGTTLATLSGGPTFGATAWATGTVLQATITAYVDPANVTISAAALNTVPAALTVFGTDDAPAIDAAVVYVAARGGGVVYLPTGGYLLATLSLEPLAYASYVCAKDGVSIIGQGVGVSSLVIFGGENARFFASNAPNVIATNQTLPLRDCFFSDFTIDWNGQQNLLTTPMSRRNNVGIFSNHGGIEINCQRMRFKETPGDQCVFMPAAAELGQRNITGRDLDFIDSGSGLAGNINTDHSSIYCNAANLMYDNLRSSNTNMQYGAQFELHGDRGNASHCKGDNLERGFWIASDYQATTGNTVDDCHYTNVRNGFGCASIPWPINGIHIHHSSFRQKPGETNPAVSYFLQGNTVNSCDYMKIDHCQFYGINMANQRFMQIDRIADFEFSDNRVYNFNDLAQGFGIVSSGIDRGGGLMADFIKINNNFWYNVWKPISITSGTLGVLMIEVLGNTGYNTVVTGQNFIALTLQTGGGIVNNNVVDGTGFVHQAMVRIQGTNTVKNKQMRSADTVYDPPSLLTGAVTLKAVTITGAKPGDFLSASFSLDQAGVTFSAYSDAVDHAQVRLKNDSAGTVDLGSGILVVRGENP